MKIVITAETTIDLQAEIKEEYNIHTTPFSILLGEKSYFDGDIDIQKIFDYVDETHALPRTCAVNQYQYKVFFDELLKEYDYIIHISLSSEMSSAYSNACLAASEYDCVSVIDSRSLSSGIALEAIYASQLVSQGFKPEEIVEKVKARIPAVQASFVVNTLSYLHKGGRCSALARFGGAIIRLKPQIIVKDGIMIPGKKFIGRSVSCVGEYCDATLEQFNNPDKSIVFLTHSGATEEMIATARSKLEEKGFKKIYTAVAGATITSHCGPKCLGILYFNDNGSAK